MKIKESLIMLLFKKNLHSWVRVSVLSILIIGSIFLLQACFPFGPEDLEDFDIVGTFYDENVNFSNFKTYAMPDTIVKITGAGVSSSKGQYDDLILDQIEANMGAVGYTRVQNPDQADMLLTVAVVNDEYNMNNSYDYGDYYGDPYDYGSGGYYDTGSDYQVSTGTVLMNLANHKDGDTTRESSMWVGILNGILEQSFTNTNRRLIELINQAFVQSPYLGTTP
jgi:hypothetical protein